MSEYDNIKKTNKKHTYNENNIDQTILAFRRACQQNDSEKAITYGLDLYFSSEKIRQLIIREIFISILEDKSLANTALFPQVYQLLVLLIKREENEEKEELKKQEKEQWKTISKDFDVDDKEYSVSTKGRIRFNDSKKRENFLKKEISGSYHYVNLNDKKINVDQIVAKTFLDNKNESEFVQHIDGNPLNDEVSNLKWVKSENAKITKNKKEPLQQYNVIKENQKTDDEDRQSYIYRFILAIYLITLSDSIQILPEAYDLFKDNIDKILEDEINVIDTPEKYRDEFEKALNDKNLANCLYYSNILYYHPDEKNEKNIKIIWGKSKKAYSYIWELFNKVTGRNTNKKNGKAPEHIIDYLHSLSELALHPEWENDKEKSYLLHIYFIHLWCLDPISAFVSAKTQEREVEIPQFGKITGSFSSDFAIRNKSTLYKRVAKLDLEIDIFLFPVNLIYLIKQIEPLNESVNEDFEFIEFNDQIKNVIGGKFDKPQDYLEETDSNELKNEDQIWQPLYIFYKFFANYDNRKQIIYIREKFGTEEEFFKNVSYPNPFNIDVLLLKKKDLSLADVESTLTDTEFISFRPYILKLLGYIDDNSFENIHPETKVKKDSISTLSFRTIPSPIRNISPIVITIKERKTPTVSEVVETNEIIEPKLRKIAIVPQTPSFSFSKKEPTKKKKNKIVFSDNE